MAQGGGTTVAAILGFIGSIGLIMSIPRLVARRPTYGPRLRSGELTAGQAAQRAADAYWAAEEGAARGNCQIAQRAFEVGEHFRTQAEEREMRGDHTGRDLKNAVRNARAEIRRCHET